MNVKVFAISGLISKMSRRMANMDFNNFCPVERTDEIGVLANSLNSLSSNLSAALMVLPYDMEGDILNDVGNMDKSVRMQYVHIAVLPLEEKSVVLAFYHKRDKIYRRLRHQINTTSREKVLQYINYLIFEHTENIYFSKTIEEELKNNKMIEKVSQEANGLPTFGHLSVDNMFGMDYEAVKPEDIPNFLDESWAIKEKVDDEKDEDK